MLIKNFYIDNLGCAKNQVDAEIIIASLEEKGWQRVAIEKADLIIINTCGFIEAAKKESIDHFFSAYANFPNKKIILTGCLAQRYGNQLKEQLPEVGGIFGANQPEQIVTFIERMESEEKPVWLPSAVPANSPRRIHRLSHKGSAYLKIAEGCRYKCSFCAIPLIRGSLRSRHIVDIIDEVKDLLAQGVFEINLVAQDLSSYGCDSHPSSQLVDLLKEISKLEGEFWVRLLYIYPDNFPEGLMNLIQADSRILPYFDLPFQHASPKILKKMGRVGKAEDYLTLIKNIKTVLPQAVFRSTFLLGYPGETEEDFDHLLQFLQQAELTWAGSFAYSAEEETASYQDAQNPTLAVDHELALERVERFMLTQLALTETNLEQFIGSTQIVLIEGKEGKKWVGRSYFNAPEVDGLILIDSLQKLEVGQRIKVKIDGIENSVDLLATVI